MLYNSLGLRVRSFEEQQEWESLCLASRKEHDREPAPEPRIKANGYSDIRNYKHRPALDLSLLDADSVTDTPRAPIRNAGTTLDLSLLDG